MDNSTHYLTYDPKEIWRVMFENYVNAGGDILYPGDEKEILLRSVQADIVQIFAGVDHALRMQTLRYAVGDYLDILGEQRDCIRIEASPAKALVTITTAATGTTDVLAAGTSMTCDGEAYYLLDEDIALTGYAQTITAGITAEKAGSAGNGLLSGSQMQLAVSNPAIVSVIVASDAAGGNEREDDDTYRDRIHEYNIASMTTGPSRQYESAAKEVSSVILDAKAVNEGAGQVGIYLILSNNSGAAAIKAAVAAALSDITTRPLTDTVTVDLAEDVTYTLNVKYICDNSSSVSAAIAAAASDYQEWQDNTIGRAFNPDRLMAAIYQAGASRVQWDTGSEFDGGTVEYTEITDTQRCKGTITLTAVNSL